MIRFKSGGKSQSVDVSLALVAAGEDRAVFLNAQMRQIRRCLGRLEDAPAHRLGRLTPGPVREPALQIRLSAFLDGPPVIAVRLFDGRELIGQIGDQGGDLVFELAGGAARFPE